MERNVSKEMIVIDTSNQQFLTVKDIQNILRIGQVSAYKIVRSDGFPAIHIGRTYRIPAQAFVEWVEAQYPEKKPNVLVADNNCTLAKLKAGRRWDA